MAEQPKTYWASDSAHGPAGNYRVVITRASHGKGPARDQYSATLFRRDEDGEQSVDADFWRSTTPPHDGDKIRFREKAKKAAEEATVPAAE